jgi:hypothetical protein
VTNVSAPLPHRQVTNITHLNSVIFKDKAGAPAVKKFISLFPGLGYAAGYKVRKSSKEKSLGKEQMIDADEVER